jgi:CubicO group peptidase (beta-lactamase class C family)
MAITRRALVSGGVAAPFLNWVGRTGVDGEEYFPAPDAEGGWREAKDAAQARSLGVDVGRLDGAFAYVKTTSQHGGLLVVRRGHLMYERYFGRGDREANPDMYSIAKMFTSVSCGMMLAEHRDRFPEGLGQKVFTEEFLPGAFPLRDVRMAGIRLGNLLTMTSGMEPRRAAGATGHMLGIVRGENVSIPYPISTDPVADKLADQDGSALLAGMWCGPGEGYLYGRDPHVASIVLRGVVGMELQAYVGEKLAGLMGLGRWGWATHVHGVTLPHTPGEGGIALRSTDALRFGYMLLRGGAWQGKQLVPREYVALCSRPSPFNVQSPFSLMFEVNADGHVAGAPRDAFFKSGAGGFGIYVVPSLDLVVYKMSTAGPETYDPAATGLPLAYVPDTSRDGWKPHPANQFLDGPVEGDAGVRRTLEMVVGACV